MLKNLAKNRYMKKSAEKITEILLPFFGPHVPGKKFW